jgi:hypothetical protein
MFTEKTIKIRRNSFILSGLSLFIGLTQSIPSKLTLLGVELDTSGQHTLGIFVFFTTLYYFLYFLSTTLPETFKFYKGHHWIVKLQKTTTGDTLGLVMKELDEIYEDSNAMHEYQEQERLLEAGDEERESQDIDRKIKDKINSSKWNHINKLKWVRLILELISPFIVGLWGLGVLGIYVFNV